MRTRSEALRELRQSLSEAGFETAALDARLLLLTALGISATDLILQSDIPLSPDQAETLASFPNDVSTMSRSPRIVGVREF